MEFTEPQKEVRRWLERRRGILLAHNYQPGEIQDVADFLGDSLALSMTAAKTPAEVIVFCGVHFMAETAAILCPDKTVLLPRQDMGCYMAATITAEQLRARKAGLPGVPVVTYVNSSAAVKAESDICCTSANALAVVRAQGDADVIFVPDRHLGSYTAEKLGRPLILWPGFCPTHQRLTVAEIAALRQPIPARRCWCIPNVPSRCGTPPIGSSRPGRCAAMWRRPRNGRSLSAPRWAFFTGSARRIRTRRSIR